MNIISFVLTSKNAKSVNDLSDEEIINEILTIITCSKKFNADDFGSWGKSIKMAVSKWVKENNVNNVEFYLDKDTIAETYGDPEKIESYTTLDIKWLSNYSELQKEANKVLPKNNVHIDTRSETKWNNEWFFTGSDATHYVLVKKI